MIPNIPKSGNYLEDCEDDRLQTEKKEEDKEASIESSLED